MLPYSECARSVGRVIIISSAREMSCSSTVLISIPVATERSSLFF